MDLGRDGPEGAIACGDPEGLDVAVWIGVLLPTFEETARPPTANYLGGHMHQVFKS